MEWNEMEWTRMKWNEMTWNEMEEVAFKMSLRKTFLMCWRGRTTTLRFTDLQVLSVILEGVHPKVNEVYSPYSSNFEIHLSLLHFACCSLSDNIVCSLGCWGQRDGDEKENVRTTPFTKSVTGRQFEEMQNKTDSEECNSCDFDVQKNGQKEMRWWT